MSREIRRAERGLGMASKGTAEVTIGAPIVIRDSPKAKRSGSWLTRRFFHRAFSPSIRGRAVLCNVYRIFAH